LSNFVIATDHFEKRDDEESIQDEESTSGRLAEAETFENVEFGDEKASDMEEEIDPVGDNAEHDDTSVTDEEEEAQTSGSECEKLSEAASDDIVFTKRKIEDDNCNETKRLKLNETSITYENDEAKSNELSEAANKLEVSH